jgi:hypothetical protein
MKRVLDDEDLEESVDNLNTSKLRKATTSG